TGKRFLVLDEIQWYAHEGLAELLRLGRRYNVHVYAATQSLASLSESVQEPLRTNVADYLLFRGDPREIREWSRWLPSVSAERLLALPQGHALFLEGKGVRVEWIRTVPPIHRPPVPTRPLTPTDGELSEGLRPDHPGPLPPHSAAPAPNDAPESTWTDLLEPAGPGLVRLRHRLLAERLGWQVAQIRRLGASLRRQGRLCRGDRDLGERSWLIRCETGPKAADRSGPEPERTPPDERGAPTE
ncbi:MAG TPA: hypothetical protein VGU43_06195, partial [Thermoplasmata archaeon]|nr:hypothetical protein [Thermoplasmata archaeon]